MCQLPSNQKLTPKRLRWIGCVIAASCISTVLGFPAIAQTSETNSPQDPAPVESSAPSDTETIAPGSLVVGVSEIPPFAIQSNEDWNGIGVHLWRQVAENLNLNYEWRQVEPEDIAEQLQSGSIDVAIALTVTAPREQQIDFTHSYFTSSLGIARQRQQSLWEIVKAVLSPRFLRICLWLSLVFIVVGVLIWFLEHRGNEEMFDKHPVRGIWAGFWWAGVTMTTIGYGDKAPKTVGGRLLGLLWMLVAMGLTASLTASITSVLALQQGRQPLQTQDLKGMEVGSVSESSTAQYLQQQNVSFQPFSTPLEGLQSVKDGKIDAFVYSDTTLRYINQEALKNLLDVESKEIQLRRYAFALTENSSLLEQIERQVLQEVEDPEWSSTLQRYLPESK